MKAGSLILLLVGAFGLGVSSLAQSEFVAQITMKGGRQQAVSKLTWRDQYFLEAPESKASIPAEAIERISFRFTYIDLAMCETLFRTGEWTKLESLLQTHVEPLRKMARFSSNLGDYFVWQLRMEFWNGRLGAAEKSIALLRNFSDQRYAPFVQLYQVLIDLERGKEPDPALYELALGMHEIPAAMRLFVRAALAYADTDYKVALQKLAKISIEHSREQEWMPAALEMEARIYLNTGRFKEAGDAADELIMAFPGTPWVEKGKKIKKQITASGGEVGS